MNEIIVRRQLAFELLKLFPESIRDDVLNRDDFRRTFELGTDATLTFSQVGLSFKRSALFSAVRELYNSSVDSVTVQTVDGRQSTLRRTEGTRRIFASTNDEIHEIPSFAILANDDRLRLQFFEENIEPLNLSSEVMLKWKERLSLRPLIEAEIEELLRDQNGIPQSVVASIREELSEPDGQISVLVPDYKQYYHDLIGRRGNAQDIVAYAEFAKPHIDRLMAWDFLAGLKQCLLFCANSCLSALVDISGREPKLIENFFQWLYLHGDRFSQIAGVEIGIKAIQEYPEVEPIIVRILENIRDDVRSDDRTQSALTANLFIFVDGELARVRTFADEPPFWRRLAAIAQASMIERVILSLGARDDDSAQWGRLRGEYFYMQSSADLRLEPRWIPDLMTPQQLRLEWLARARIAGTAEKDRLPEGPLKSLLLGEESNQLAAITSVPHAYAPSPVEAGLIAPSPFPDELLAGLKSTKGDKPLEAQIFAGLVNFAFVFRFDNEIAGLIVELLHRVKYRIGLNADTNISFSVLMGLAEVAAATRHTELADEVRVLTRVLRRRGEIDAEPEGHMRIALLACASRIELKDWCRALGSWLFEIANSDIKREDANNLRFLIRRLCGAEPALWDHVAMADAALALAAR